MLETLLILSWSIIQNYRNIFIIIFILLFFNFFCANGRIIDLPSLINLSFAQKKHEKGFELYWCFCFEYCTTFNCLCKHFHLCVIYTGIDELYLYIFVNSFRKSSNGVEWYQFYVLVFSRYQIMELRLAPTHTSSDCHPNDK